MCRFCGCEPDQPVKRKKCNVCVGQGCPSCEPSDEDNERDEND